MCAYAIVFLTDGVTIKLEREGNLKAMQFMSPRS